MTTPPTPNQPSPEGEFEDGRARICDHCGRRYNILSSAPHCDKHQPKNPAGAGLQGVATIQPEVDTAILAYYWGKPWSERGVYPEWSRYNDEQKAEVLELQSLINQRIAAVLGEELELDTLFGGSLRQRLLDRLASLAKYGDGK